MKGAVGGEVFTIHIISRLLGSENSSAHLSRRVTERSGWGRPISSPGSSCSSAARSQLNLTFASFQEVRLKYCYGNISTTNYCSAHCSRAVIEHTRSFKCSVTKCLAAKKIFWIHLFELKLRTAQWGEAPAESGALCKRVARCVVFRTH